MEVIVSEILNALEHNKRIVIQGGGNSFQFSKDDFIIGLNVSENVNILISNENKPEPSLKKGVFVSISGELRRVIDIENEELNVFDLDKELFRDFGSRIDFYPILWLTALRIVEFCVARSKRNVRVYLSGIDLNDKGLINPSPQTIRNFHLQEYLLSEVKAYYNADGRLTIIRFGEDIDYPKARKNISEGKLKDLYGELMRKAREEDYVVVVAEVTNNHFGSFERLERIVRECKAAGADMIKVQKRDVKTFFTNEKLEEPYISPFGNTFLDYRLGCELSFDDLVKLDTLCIELEIPWFASVLDESSLVDILPLNPVLVKLPSTISRRMKYLTSVNSHYEGDLVISTGYTDDSYIHFLQKYFIDDCKRNVWLLHATSAYPTPENQAQVAVVRGYSKLAENNKSIIPGYSSHDTDDIVPLLSIAAGAKMIEKHVKLGNTDWIHFDEVAFDLETVAFKEFIQKVRRVSKICANEKRRVQKSENHKY